MQQHKSMENRPHSHPQQLEQQKARQVATVIAPSAAAPVKDSGGKLGWASKSSNTVEHNNRNTTSRSLSVNNEKDGWAEWNGRVNDDVGDGEVAGLK
jgi:hypothetical protein